MIGNYEGSVSFVMVNVITSGFCSSQDVYSGFKFAARVVARTLGDFIMGVHVRGKLL